MPIVTSEVSVCYAGFIWQLPDSNVFLQWVPQEIGMREVLGFGVM